MDNISLHFLERNEFEEFFTCLFTPLIKNSNSCLVYFFLKLIQFLENEFSLIEGVELYSWKDTGITDASEEKSVKPTHLRDQAGHHSLEMTMLYYEARKINKGMRDIQNRIDE